MAPAVKYAVLALLAFAVLSLGVEAATLDSTGTAACTCDPPGKLCFHFASSPYRIGPENCNVLCEDPPAACTPTKTAYALPGSGADSGVALWTNGGSTTYPSAPFVQVFNDPTDELGLRFDLDTIPSGAHIISATITLKSASSTNSFTAEVHGVAEDSASAWHATDKLSTKVLTGCSAVWTGEATGGDITSPNLAKIVQQIVDRPNYVSGGIMKFVLSDGGNSGMLSFQSQDDIDRRRKLLVPSSVSPKLTIEWTLLDGCPAP